MGEFLKEREDLRKESRTMEEDMRLSLSKKRKVHPKLEDEHCGQAELAENSVSPAASRTSSCSKHEDSSDVAKKSPRSSDLEVRFRNSNALLDSVLSVELCPLCFRFRSVTAIFSFLEELLT